MFLTKEADYFQKVGFAQGDAFLALGAENFLTQVAVVKPEMHAAGGTGHFDEFSGFCPASG